MRSCHTHNHYLNIPTPPNTNIITSKLKTVHFTSCIESSTLRQYDVIYNQQWATRKKVTKLCTRNRSVPKRCHFYIDVTLSRCNNKLKAQF